MSQLPTTERELQQWVLAVAKMGRWMAYHTFDSRRSQPGFPDLILIRGTTLIAAELKVGGNHPSPIQLEWLEAFAAVRRVEAMVIRDGAEYDGVAERLLRADAHTEGQDGTR